MDSMDRSEPVNLPLDKRHASVGPIGRINDETPGYSFNVGSHDRERADDDHNQKKSSVATCLEQYCKNVWEIQRENFRQI